MYIYSNFKNLQEIQKLYNPKQVSKAILNESRANVVAANINVVTNDFSLINIQKFILTNDLTQ